jgi:hypothetical protein
VLQVLVTRRRIAWLPDSDGNVPNGALPVGETQTGETLYMARVEHDTSLTPGKVLIVTCLLHKTNVVMRKERFCIDLNFVPCELSS